jgi:Fe-S-cluster containining protein
MQPCAAHDGCKCSIYSSRPVYCRQFECSLLKRVNSRQLEKKEALRLIYLARDHLVRIRLGLRELGEANETLSHRVRFKKMATQIERAGPHHPKARVFADLTLAIHDLDLLLVESFYPG